MISLKPIEGLTIGLIGTMLCSAGILAYNGTLALAYTGLLPFYCVMLGFCYGVWYSNNKKNQKKEIREKDEWDRLLEQSEMPKLRL